MILIIVLLLSVSNASYINNPEEHQFIYKRQSSNTTLIPIDPTEPTPTPSSTGTGDTPVVTRTSIIIDPTGGVTTTTITDAGSQATPDGSSQNNTTETSSGGLSTGALWAIVVIVVCVVGAAIAIFIFRKWKLRPSNAFKNRKHNNGNPTVNTYTGETTTTPTPAPSTTPELIPPPVVETTATQPLYYDGHQIYMDANGQQYYAYDPNQSPVYVATSGAPTTQGGYYVTDLASGVGEHPQEQPITSGAGGYATYYSHS